jgi:hypothetical protein
MNWPTVLWTLREIAVPIAALVGAWIAWQGLDTWRRELKGKAEYELARRILRCLYKMRDGIRDLRNPFIRAYEFPKREGGYQELSPKRSAEDYSHVFENRWKPIRDAYRNLDIEMLEGEVLWGQAFRANFSDLEKCVADLRFNMDMFIASQDPESQVAPDQVSSYKRILFTYRDGKDTFAQTIEDAIRKLERAVRPHLRR